MRVTIIAADLSQNGAARSHMLARVLAPDFAVEIVGCTFGDGVWPPMRGHAAGMTVVRGRRWPASLLSLRHVRRRCRGDVLIAVKPLLPSFGVALQHRARTGTPIVLDIDDDELAFRPAPPAWHPLRAFASRLSPHGHAATRAMVARIAEADAITVASAALQERYGGMLVPHTRDLTRVEARPDRVRAMRAQLAVPADRAVIMFAGTARPHKGLEDAAAAVAAMRHPATFVVVGPGDDAGYAAAFARRHPEVLVLPGVPIEDAHLPVLAADIVLIPQRDSPAARAQMPAKIIDAMALAKPVVATAVSDLPRYLADGRGWIVPPSDPGALARACDAILDDPAAARAAGQRARAWCLEHLSDDAVRQRYADLVRAVWPVA